MSALTRLLSMQKATAPVLEAPANVVSTAVAQRRLASMIETKKSVTGGVDPTRFYEVRRICDLPVVSTMTPAELEQFSRNNILAGAYESGFRLFSTQANAIKAYEDHNGGFFPIGVGDGKTLTGLCVAQKAFQKGIKKIILIIPSQVMHETTKIHIPQARNWVPISYPIMAINKFSSNKRRAVARSGRSGVYLMSDSLVSTKYGEEILTSIEPGLVIVDEAHHFARSSSARTKRLRNLIKKFSPEFVCMSGTMTGKSIKDYHHLVAWSLKMGSPVPLNNSMVAEWGSILDAPTGAGAVEWEGNDMANGAGPLKPLIRWARNTFPDREYTEDVAGFRLAYSDRLVATGGVVTSKGKTLGVTLRIENVPVENASQCDGWTDLNDHIRRIEEDWSTPDGDPIDHAIHQFKWMFELSSAGFYNSQFWPDVSTYAQRKRMTEQEAEIILEMAAEYLDHHRSYLGELREWLKYRAKPGMDTPFLVASDMRHNGAKNVSADLHTAWLEMCEKDFPGRPDRDKRVVRVCPFKVNSAVAWAAALPKGKGGIVWVFNQGVGVWTHELLQEAGIDSLHCPAGRVGNETISDPAHADRIMVASITAHCTGKNLQHFQHQYFVQWPRSAKMAEQVLGRLHRSGQKADEIVATTSHTLDFDHLNFAACLNDALYIHQTIKARQKVIYANYNPLPRIFPPMVLKQRGFEPNLLSQEDQNYMTERFGSGSESQ